METLTINADAWAKLLYMMKQADGSEISGFGISKADDIFRIHDFFMVEQEGSMASTEMTEDGIADYAERMLDKGYEPCEYMRIWIHTHPKGVDGPSKTDLDNMKDLFGACDFGIMLIVTETYVTIAELWLTALGSQHRLVMKLEVDWEETKPTNPDEWDKEFKEMFNEQIYVSKATQNAAVQTYTPAVSQFTPYNRDFANQQFQDEYFDDDECLECLQGQGEITLEQANAYMAMLRKGEPLPDTVIAAYRNLYTYDPVY